MKAEKCPWLTLDKFSTVRYCNSKKENVRKVF